MPNLTTSLININFPIPKSKVKYRFQWILDELCGLSRFNQKSNEITERYRWMGTGKCVASNCSNWSGYESRASSHSIPPLSAPFLHNYRVRNMWIICFECRIADRHVMWERAPLSSRPICSTWYAQAIHFWFGRPRQTCATLRQCLCWRGISENFLKNDADISQSICRKSFTPVRLATGERRVGWNVAASTHRHWME